MTLASIVVLSAGERDGTRRVLRGDVVALERCLIRSLRFA